VNNVDITDRSYMLLRHSRRKARPFRRSVTARYRHAMPAFLPFVVAVEYNGGVSTILWFT
jgi:hypothetical protein